MESIDLTTTEFDETIDPNDILGNFTAQDLINIKMKDLKDIVEYCNGKGNYWKSAK